MYAVKITKKYAEKIKDFSEITGDAKKHFISERPCSYENMDGKIFVCDRSDIIELPSYAKKKIGNLYLI